MNAEWKDIKDPVIVSRLESLGFTKAARNVKEMAVKKRKMAIAYEHYRFVRPEKIDDFNKKLFAKRKNDYSFDKLSFTPLKDYPEVPPTDVLDCLEGAVQHQCFDAFEVAHIVNVKDPILFGRVEGCSDRFYIAQWDDDVKIEDILKPNEG